MDKKILVVDDEEEIRMVLRETLVSVGYKIFEAANAVEALSRIEKESFNLIILDLVMPETSGFEFLKQIRKTSNVPVIVLSGKTDTGDKVESLMLGADDYITKPWKMVELNARISAVLRRTEKIDYNASQLFNDGRLAIDCVKRSVPLGGNEIHLTLKEYELLQKLVLNRGIAIEYQRLLWDVWGTPHGHDKKLVHAVVNRLRAKIEDDPTNPKYIQAVDGVGYLFAGKP